MGFLSGIFGSSGQKEVSRILKELGGLAEENEDERSALRSQLLNLGLAAVTPLDKWLGRAPRVSASKWMMRDVCEVLALIGDDALLVLAPFARNDPPERRAAALLALGASGRQEAVPVCVEALESSADEVVAAACTAIKAIGDPAAIDDLTRVLADTSRPDGVRAAMVSTIASLKGPKAARAIIDAAGDPKLGAVIPGCFAAMGPLVVPTVVEGLDSPTPAVRKVLVQSLAAIGPIGGDAAVRGLAKALRDQDADVRSAAAEALQKIDRFEPLVAALRDENFDNRFVLRALSEMGHNRELMQAYQNLLEAMGRRITTGSMFAVEKLKEAEHLTPALRYLEEVTQYLPDDSDFMEPAIRLKRDVRAQLQSRAGRR